VSITIRLWKQDDLEVVRYILWETWKDAYAKFIPLEDLQAYYDEHCTSDTLADQYRDSNVKGLVAEYGGVIAGYEKIFYNEKENRLYVQQLYILPAYHNLGLGRKLMESAAELAVSKDLDAVWLGVMVKNESAVAWYKKMGFEIVENVPFTMGRTTVDHYIGYVPVGKILRFDIQ
jgi:diamine N-acetyltransferase